MNALSILICSLLVVGCTLSPPNGVISVTLTEADRATEAIVTPTVLVPTQEFTPLASPTPVAPTSTPISGPTITGISVTDTPSKTPIPAHILEPLVTAPESRYGLRFDSWSPGGEWIAYWIGERSEGFPAYLASVAPGSGKLCPHEAVVAQNLWSGSITWQEDGSATVITSLGKEPLRGTPCQQFSLVEKRTVPEATGEISPDGRWLAFQSIGPNRGDPIYLLDLASGSLDEVPGSQIHSGVRPSLVWSPDGQTLTLPALGEACTRILDVNTGAEQLYLQAEDGCYMPWAVAYAPDNQHLALAGPTGGVTIIRPDNGQMMGHLPGNVLIRPDRTVQPLRFSPDGRRLVSSGGFDFGGNAFPTLVWDVAAAAVVAEQPPTTGTSRLALAFAGDALLSLYADGRITRWPFTKDGATETAVGQIPVIAPYRELNWSADSRRLAAPLTFGGTAVWDAASGERLALFEAPLINPRLSPDGRLLALFDPERRGISLHDVDRGVVTATIADADSLPAGNPFSPDQRWLAYGLGNRLHLADVNTGETAVILTGYPCCVTIAAFNPSGSRVAFEMSPDFEASSLAIDVYDRQQGLVTLHLTEHELQAWSSDEWLLTNESQFDSRFTQWNIISGRKTVSTASKHGSELYAPNGLFHATMSSSGPNIGRTLKIGSWLSKQSVAQANVGNDVGVISWSPDGRWLAALASDSSLWLWPVSFPQP